MGNKKNPNIEVKTYIVQGDTSKVYKAKTATTIKASIASVEVEKIESERSDAIKAAVAKVREDFKDRVKAARKAIVVTEISGAKLLDLGDFEVVDLSATPEPEATGEQDGF